jgi:hypothetical protein
VFAIKLRKRLSSALSTKSSRTIKKYAQHHVYIIVLHLYISFLIDISVVLQKSSIAIVIFDSTFRVNQRLSVSAADIAAGIIASPLLRHEVTMR